MNNEKEKSIRDIKWDKMYELAKAYYEYHGNLDIPIKLEIEGYEQDKITKLVDR